MNKSLLNNFKSAICRNSGHQWSEWKVNDGICTTTRFCKRCSIEESLKIQHDWSPWKEVPGHCMERHICGHCGTQGDRPFEHDWGPQFLNKNCTYSSVCKRCGKEVNFGTPSHTWSEWKNTPDHNCSNHQMVKECTNCHQLEISQQIKHSWSEWRSTGEACVMERSCSFCGKKESQVQHSWSEWFIAKHCTYRRTCCNCLKSETEVKHSWSEWNYDKQCRMSRICNNCKEIETGKTAHEFQLINQIYEGSRQMGGGDDYQYFYLCQYKCKRCGVEREYHRSDYEDMDHLAE